MSRLRRRWVLWMSLAWGCSATASPPVAPPERDYPDDAPADCFAIGRTMSTLDALACEPWIELRRWQGTLGGASISVVELAWPGNDAAIVVTRGHGADHVLLGADVIEHGGNGVDLEIVHARCGDPGRVDLVFRVQRHYRGYYLSDEACEEALSDDAGEAAWAAWEARCHVPADTEESGLELRVAADEARAFEVESPPASVSVELDGWACP